MAVRAKAIKAKNKQLVKKAGDSIIGGNGKQSTKAESNDSKYSIDAARVANRDSTPRVHAGQRPSLSETEKADRIAELEDTEFYDNFRPGGGGFTLDPADAKACHTSSTGRGLAGEERVANFKKWFGNSLAEYKGVPMVFFQKPETFNSGGPEMWAFDDALLGSNLKHARIGLWPHFYADADPGRYVQRNESRLLSST